jgi:hypothetical protein
MAKKSKTNPRGAGRKPHPYRTKIVSFRVRMGWIDAIRKAVAAERERLEAASTGAATTEATPGKETQQMPP